MTVAYVEELASVFISLPDRQVVSEKRCITNVSRHKISLVLVCCVMMRIVDFIEMDRMAEALFHCFRVRKTAPFWNLTDNINLYIPFARRSIHFRIE